MTTNDLAAIRARTDKATPGPWKAVHRHIDCTTEDDEQSGLGLEIDGPPEAWNRGQFARGADAAFIASARTDVPNLCDEVEALRGELARAREALELAGDGLEFAGTVLLEEGAIKDEYLLQGYGEKLREYLRDAGRGEGE